MSVEIQARTHKVSSVVPGKEGGVSAVPAYFPRGLRIGFWFCIVVAIAVVLRRVLALSTPPNPHAPPQLAALDTYFASHATLTYIHILCSLAIILLLPLLFWHRTRGSIRIKQAFFFLGVMVGGTAYAMSTHAIGGWLERSAVLTFNTLFLASLAMAFRYTRHGDGEHRQRWTLRAIAILLGIATTRPVMGIFFATSHWTGLRPQQFFGIAFWIGFSLNTVVIELWLRNRNLSAERIRA
ncbi:MAG: DUF2306 domain-containing protein [Candidatus Sulfotelmatobacter sp.]